MEQDYDLSHWKKPCEPTKCKEESVGGLGFFCIPTSLGDDSPTSKVAPRNGAYSNMIVQYERNGAVYIYSREGVPVNVKEGK